MTLTRRFFSLLAALALLLCAGEVRADGFGAFIEYNYNASDLTATDPTGVRTHTSADSFMQRYNLSFDRALYPLVQLSAGTIIEHDDLHNSSRNSRDSGSSTQVSPSVNLAFTNPTMPTNFGYQRREESSIANGISAPAQILESYTARTNLNLENVPPISLSYSHFESYDENRISHDLISQNVLWSTYAQPRNNLSLSYQGSYTDTENAISRVTSDTLNNSGRIGYGGTLFNNRLTYSTNYNLSSTSTSVSSNGGGTVYTAQTPSTGLSATSSLASIPPLTATTGPLPANPALATGGANINLVTVTTPPAGTQIQMGLDFGFGNAITVNTLYLTIISGTNLRPSQLAQIPTINTLFGWDAYTSSDGVNWSLLQSGVTQLFGNDPTGISDTVGFTLDLPHTVSSRYLKVVVTPVSSDTLLPFAGIPGIDIRSIAVTRLQAFAKQSALTFPKGTNTSVSGQFGLNASAKLLEDPGLYYDMSFGYAHSSSNSQSFTYNWFLTNGIGLDKQLTPIVSFAARANLQQQSASDGVNSTVSYNAGLSIVPLPTLSDTLTYSGSISGLGSATTTTTNAFYLSNTAELYRGVSFSLAGGYSSSTASSGEKSDSVTMSSGVSVIPRRDFSFNVSYAESSTRSSGGASGSTYTDQRGGGITATYTPFPALYFSGSYSVSSGTGQSTSTSRNFSTSWAPFQGGALSLNFSYAESLTTPDDQKTRTVSPSLRWKISPRITFDLNYQYFHIDSPAAGVVEGESTGASLRLSI